MKETDQELLELAAKAVGILELRGAASKFHCYYVVDDEQVVKWNPITDDGDAFRLAAKLNIAVQQYPIYTSPKHSVIAKVPSLDDSKVEVLEMYGEDKLQATRKVIVRCAAEIGRMMKE